VLDYYVYAYLRAIDNTPYYIGKGKGKRVYGPHNVSVPADRSKIVFLEKDLTNVGACAIERRMIKWYGRIDQNTGILRNRTDGGEGAVGRVFTKEHKQKIGTTKVGNQYCLGLIRSPVTREKMSQAKSGIKHSDEHRLNNRLAKLGTVHSEETKNKMRQSHLGVKFSEERKQKISLGQKERWKNAKSRKIAR
jgi:hypothetical protein